MGYCETEKRLFPNDRYATFKRMKKSTSSSVFFAGFNMCKPGLYYVEVHGTKAVLRNLII